MTDERKPINEGYQPLKKGYQPESPSPPSKPPESGYQPTTGHGDNPSNRPSPPKEE